MVIGWALLIWYTCNSTFVAPVPTEAYSLPKVHLILAVAALLAATACTQVDRSDDFGVQSDAAAFVPARIAIMPCRAWPAAARWEGQPLTSVKDAEVQRLCDVADEFVEDGFVNQPYMRGNSKRFVQKTLSEAGLLDKLDLLPRLWARRPGEACKDCQSAPALYRSLLRERPDWVAWLAELSSKLKNADAMLFPFVTHAYERSYDDRGLKVAERGLGVVLLLIDTATGELLWAGGRHTVVPNKRLASTRVPGPLELPAWALAEERVFAAELWRDFPGRQIY
jgi:hypothetical protein